jgi:hypothetical protein
MSDEINVGGKFVRLRDCLARNDEDGVRDAIFDLGGIRNDWIKIPDGVVESLLTLLVSQKMYESTSSGQVLSFFVFESSRLTDRQKWLCIEFLNAHGDEFVDAYGQQMVIELRTENYLKMKKPNETHWNDWLKMKTHYK